MMLCFLLVLLLAAAPTYQRTVFLSHTEQKPQILSIQFAEPSDFDVRKWRNGIVRDYEIVKCLDCNMTTIESGTFDIPGNKIKTFNLTLNNIATLKSEAFNGLIFLKRLILSNNHIKDILPETFLGLNTLEFLDLQNNEITRLVQNGFKALTNLRQLYLRNNSIANIENEALKGLVSLEDLDLSHNNIDRLTFNNVLPELKSLDLSYNNLKHFDYKLLVDQMPKLGFINIENSSLPCNIGKEMKSYFKEDNLEFILATDSDDPGFKCDDVNILSDKPNLN